MPASEMEVTGASQLDVEMEVTGDSLPDVAQPCASSSSALQTTSAPLNDAPQLADANELPTSYRDVFDSVFKTNTSASQPSVSSQQNLPSRQQEKHQAEQFPAGHPDVPSVVQKVLDLDRYPQNRKNPLNETEI